MRLLDRLEGGPTVGRRSAEAGAGAEGPALVVLQLARAPRLLVAGLADGAGDIPGVRGAAAGRRASADR